MVGSEHYGVRVVGMPLHFECGDHSFEREGLQEGPCVCPVCGRRFVLTWSVNVEPWEGEGEPDSAWTPTTAEAAPSVSETDAIGQDDTTATCQHGEPVKWNPYNGVVQCHRCGQVFVPDVAQWAPYPLNDIYVNLPDTKALLQARINEAYEAIQAVERVGCSVELTAAVTVLGERMQQHRRQLAAILEAGDDESGEGAA